MNLPTSIGSDLWYTAYTLDASYPPKIAIGHATPPPYMVLATSSSGKYPWKATNFASQGWFTVPSGNLIIGLSGSGTVSGLSKVASTQVGSTAGMECIEEYMPWPNAGGYSSCPEGSYLQGLYRAYAANIGDSDISVIERAKCCKPKEYPNTWGTCYDVNGYGPGLGGKNRRCTDWQNTTATGAKIPSGLVSAVIVGFRSLPSPSGLGVNAIANIKCCNFPSADLIVAGSAIPQPLIQPTPQPTAPPTPTPTVYIAPPTPVPPTPVPPTPVPPTPAPPTPVPTPAPYTRSCTSEWWNGYTIHPLSWYQSCSPGWEINWAYRTYTACYWFFGQHCYTATDYAMGRYLCYRSWGCSQAWNTGNCCR